MPLIIVDDQANNVLHAAALYQSARYRSQILRSLAYALIGEIENKRKRSFLPWSHWQKATQSISLLKTIANYADRG